MDYCAFKARFAAGNHVSGKIPAAFYAVLLDTTAV